jgi:hypothetical protein
MQKVRSGRELRVRNEILQEEPAIERRDRCQVHGERAPTRYRRAPARELADLVIGMERL